MKTFMQLLENNAQQNQFINQIIAEWPNTETMQIYADWLEEQGNPLAQIYHNQPVFTAYSTESEGQPLPDPNAKIIQTKQNRLFDIIDILTDWFAGGEWEQVEGQWTYSKPYDSIFKDGRWQPKIKQYVISYNKGPLPPEINNIITAIRRKEKLQENTQDNIQFLNRITDEWPDTQSMQIYADWLEEQGNPLAPLYRDIAEEKKVFSLREHIEFTSRMTTTENLHPMNLKEVINHLIGQSYRRNNQVGPSNNGWTVTSPTFKKDITMKINNQYTPREIHEVIMGIYNKHKPSDKAIQGFQQNLNQF